MDSGSAEPVSQLSRQEDIQLIEGKVMLQLQRYSIIIKYNSCYVFDACPYTIESLVKSLECTVEDLTPVKSSWSGVGCSNHTDKKKIKFSLYMMKFIMEQLQSHIWLTASSYMVKYLRISSFIRKPFFIYDFATAPFWISLYMRKIFFSLLSVQRAS